MVCFLVVMALDVASKCHSAVTFPCQQATMDQITRFAVYYAPRPGPFADAAARWLGRDAATGAASTQPVLPGLPRGLAEVTVAPRKYGFHGTLRAPFRPAPGLGPKDIAEAVDTLARRIAPAHAGGLQVTTLHGFLALVPTGDLATLGALAEQVVRGTNMLRAPLTPAETLRRRPETLSPRQRTHLDRWGYPYIFEDFIFHLTLTDQLPQAEATALTAHATAYFAGLLPDPFVIEDLCLFGENPDGQFHLLHCAPLHG